MCSRLYFHVHDVFSCLHLCPYLCSLACMRSTADYDSSLLAVKGDDDADFQELRDVDCSGPMTEPSPSAACLTPVSSTAGVCLFRWKAGALNPPCLCVSASAHSIPYTMSAPTEPKPSAALLKSQLASSRNLRILHVESGRAFALL